MAAEKTQRLVLLVDDYEDSRFIYVHTLTQAGFAVAEAADGQEALDKAFALAPDVIVMDLSLPVIDGWEAIRRLRSDERTAKTPIVALTGHSLSPGDNNPGYDELLVKPCLPDTVVAAIKKRVDGSSST